ncbi:MAG: hypothetical protein ABSG37_13395 [Candidatus Limnocylindrales bacterium]|jgi:O6-methylguanine-DNA--protein-cysteine methyltransferase
MARAKTPNSNAAAGAAIELMGKAFRQEVDLTDPKVRQELKKANRLIQGWNAGRADEAAERASAERHAEAAARQYARATANIANPNPIVVTVGRVRSTVERIADLPVESPKRLRSPAKSHPSGPTGSSSPS